MKTRPISLIPVTGIPLIQPGDDLATIIVERLKASENDLVAGDILILAHKVVSKAEGAIVDLASCRPSQAAEQLSQASNKDPRLIELILHESKKIVRQRTNLIIAEHKKGWICANAGIDYSNVSGECVSLLPRDPDHAAQQIRQRIKDLSTVDIAVIINDSQGRPFRKGSVSVALGSSGICALVDKRGNEDLFGYRVKHTEVALIDQLASAASLLMGETNEGIPAVIIRGFRYPKGRNKARDLIRPEESDLFRKPL